MNNLYKIILFIFSINIYSHEFNPAHLIIDQSSINENLYEATWLYPVKNIGIGSDEIFSGYYDHHLLYLNEIKKMKNLYNQSCANWKKIIKPIVRNPFLKKMKF